MVFSVAKLDHENNNKPPSRAKCAGESFIQSARTYSERNIKIWRRSGANVPEGRKLDPIKAILKVKGHFTGFILRN